MYLGSFSVQKKELRKDRVAVTVPLLAAVSVFVGTSARAAVCTAHTAVSLPADNQGANTKIDVAVIAPVHDYLSDPGASGSVGEGGV
jgi:hypothetical protein